MLKILINIKTYANYSTYTVNRGFLMIPEEFRPFWINQRQFQIQNNKMKDFITFLLLEGAEIYYRYNRNADWTPLKDPREYKNNSSDQDRK